MVVEANWNRFSFFRSRFCAASGAVIGSKQKLQDAVNDRLGISVVCQRITSRSRTKRDMVLVRLVVFAIVDAANVGTSALQFHALKLLTAAYNVIDSEPFDALDELEDFRSAYDSIVRGAAEQLRRMAASGKSDEFETSARNLLRLKFTEKQTRQVLQALYVDRGQLDGSIQRVLAELLGMGRVEQPAEPDFESGNAPSVQSVQLASALIRSWNAARDSQRSHEAFDELVSVLHNFFEIQLKGQPGEIVEFNPLVHELPPTHGSKPSHVHVIFQQFGVVLAHLFEVQDDPAFVHKVTMKSSGELAEHTAIGRAFKLLRHAEAVRHTLSGS